MGPITGCYIPNCDKTSVFSYIVYIFKVIAFIYIHLFYAVLKQVYHVDKCMKYRNVCIYLHVKCFTYTCVHVNVLIIV